MAVGHRDGAAQQPQLVVGADEADELDPAGRRPTGGDLVDAQRIAARRGRGLVGRAPVGRLVAVLAVVEGLERAGALGELVAVGEALLAEEALVEGVVEALDRAVAPRLSAG